MYIASQNASTPMRCVALLARNPHALSFYGKTISRREGNSSQLMEQLVHLICNVCTYHPFNNDLIGAYLAEDSKFAEKLPHVYLAASKAPSEPYLPKKRVRSPPSDRSAFLCNSSTWIGRYPFCIKMCHWIIQGICFISEIMASRPGIYAPGFCRRSYLDC